MGRLTTIKTSYINSKYEERNVNVEIKVMDGIGIHVIGLPDEAVSETLLRTITAIQASGYKLPGRKIIINIAPAIKSKEDNTSVLDLPIAIGILAESGQINFPDSNVAYIPCGVLAVDGKILHPFYNLAGMVNYIEHNQK